jgi:alkanesulfonate monooxygenase SsuD/methylene tetrahydromethanopterin reductase-like flavin-dependent oxidoreductase (luciferase family)
VTIAAHGPRMLRIAAEHADGWDSWGGYDVATEEAFYAVTADRSHRFDDLCVDPYIFRIMGCWAARSSQVAACPRACRS